MADTTVQPNNKLSAPNRKVPAMAKLTTEDRKELPAKSFAGPGRSYPIEDKSHAANAKSRSAQMMKRGLISEKEHAKIVGKADAVLGKPKSAPKPMKSDNDGDEGAEKDDPPASKPRGSDQADVKVKPGSAGWNT